MPVNIEDLESRRREHSDKYWERKARFTYYTVSLPFVFLAVAVSSFPYGSTTERSILILEIVGWVLFLLAGGVGLRGKWGEMEIQRKSAIILSGMIAHAEDGLPSSADSARSSREQEERRIRAENAEEFGANWLFPLLGLGLLTWLAARTVIAFCSAALA